MWHYVLPNEVSEAASGLKPWLSEAKLGIDLVNASLEEQWAMFRNSRIEDELSRIHLAQSLMGPDEKDEKKITADEYRKYRLMIVGSTLHTAIGHLGLWDNTPDDHAPPPNYGKYLATTRFKRIHHFAQFAFATNECIQRASTGTQVLPWEMIHHRLESVRLRKLTSEAPTDVLADEVRIFHKPRTDRLGGAPFLSYEPSKPDEIAAEIKNTINPTTYTTLFHEPVDDAKKMMELDFSEYGASTARSLRLMRGSGATKDNTGHYYGDTAFVSLDLISAAAEHFPGWSVTGIIKANNCKNVPYQFLRDLCESAHGRIVKGGTNHFMTTTLEGGIKVALIAHKWCEERTVVIISTAGDFSMGEDYVQHWRDGEHEYTSEIRRPSTVSRFYRFSGRIDTMNHYLALLKIRTKWPTRSFWKKMSVWYEGHHVVEWYLAARQSGKLRSGTRGDGRGDHPETLMQFVKRVICTLLRPDPKLVKLTVHDTVFQSEHEDRVPVRVPNGMHAPGRKLSNTKKHKDGLVRVSFSRKTCEVCRAMNRRMNDKQRGYPQTMTFCRHCDGFVHGPDADGYPDCWKHHLLHRIDNLYHSGDMVSFIE